jgi:transcriptional regulator with XRE-family HTH domain
MGKRLYCDAREAVRALLREARSQSGLTQIELSRKLGRPQSYVSDYERGHRRLDWVAVHEVLDACDYDLLAFTKAYLRAARAGRPG